MDHEVFPPDVHQITVVVVPGETGDDLRRDVTGIGFEVPLEDEGVRLLHDGPVAFVVEALALKEDVLLSDFLRLLLVPDIHDEGEIDLVAAVGWATGNM